MPQGLLSTIVASIYLFMMGISWNSYGNVNNTFLDAYESVAEEGMKKVAQQI